VNLDGGARYYTGMAAPSVPGTRCVPRAPAVVADGHPVTSTPTDPTRNDGSAGHPGDASVTDSAGVRDAVEVALLERIAAGERTGLVELYTAYSTRLFAFHGRLAPDAATAEELVQDTLLAVWRSAATFQHRSSVRTWIYAVARRQASNRLRKATLTVVALDQAGPLADDAATPEEHALHAADRDRLAGLLGQLSLVHREALVLFFLDDLTHAEMAEILDVPIGTVKSRLSNARWALVRLATADGEQP
jgi:RNA polymerase sigma factor (sigma-70 family)